MHDAVRSFADQLSFSPIIVNEEKLDRTKPLVVCAMGGSHLAADIYRLFDVRAIVAIHSDYGIPALAGEPQDYTYVISSFSGNTEEIIESYEWVRENECGYIVVASGGELLKRAKADGAPYIELPAAGIQPRAALGFGLRALAAITDNAEVFSDIADSATRIDMAACETTGRELAAKLFGRIPVIYASGANGAIAQNWKIKCNENAKIPAFWNTIPELNHNEMTGFDVTDTTRFLSAGISVVILRDLNEHPRNQRRSDITRALYEDRGISVSEIEMVGLTHIDRTINTLLIGDWMSIALGEQYGAEIEQVPMVEAFKKMIG